MASPAALVALLLAPVSAQEQLPEAPDGPAAARYVLNYPVAEAFCAPVRSYFDDITQPVYRVGNRVFYHPPNGAYGISLGAKVAGRNVLHLGADVAWHRPGEPVFAIAAGVVRVSEGLSGNPRDKERAKAPDGGKSARAKPDVPRSPAAGPAGRVLAWGNLIAIEHCLPDKTYITSVYGHLAGERLVAVGDVVEAGRMIGRVGRPGVENGGYKAHLHFGVREGRMAEPGMELFKAPGAGKAPVTLVSLGEERIEVRVDEDLPPLVTLHVNGRAFAMTARDGKRWLPADILNLVRRPDFQIVGHGLSTKGWRDPTELLRAMGADANPAPLQPLPPAPN